ncbi:MAG: nucleoside hydrolase, partial [Chloroflexota bacterium]
MPLTMVGIEISRAARFLPKEIQELAALGTARARACAAFLEYTLTVAHQRGRVVPGEVFGAGCPDGTAMAVALEPEVLIDAGRYHVDVETHGELTAGETVVDRRNVLGRPP